jgi:hypothetical protein
VKLAAGDLQRISHPFILPLRVPVVLLVQG